MNPATVTVKLGSIPPASRASSTPTPTAAPANPGSVPIVDCATTIHTLCGDARGLHKAFDETLRQILRTPERSRPSSSVSHWRTYSEEYQSIIHASDAAATSLASTITVYLALQGGLSEEDADDMIEELSTLRKDLSKAPTDMSASCIVLKGRLEACLLALTSSSAMRSPSGSQRSSRNEVNSNTLQQSIRACLWRAWGRVSTAFAALQQLDDCKSAAHGQPQPISRDPSRGISALPDVVNTIQASWVPEVGKRVRGEYTPVTQTAQSSSEAALSETDTLARAIKDIIASLDKQVVMFNAFPDVAKHLDNEMNAYLSVFQAVKTYPTPEKRTALQNMHTRVAASARLWRELASVLTDGYARLQK